MEELTELRLKLHLARCDVGRGIGTRTDDFLARVNYIFRSLEAAGSIRGWRLSIKGQAENEIREDMCLSVDWEFEIDFSGAPFKYTKHADFRIGDLLAELVVVMEVMET
jgi:hypothetical protein